MSLSARGKKLVVIALERPHPVALEIALGMHRALEAELDPTQVFFVPEADRLNDEFETWLENNPEPSTWVTISESEMAENTSSVTRFAQEVGFEVQVHPISIG